MKSIVEFLTESKSSYSLNDIFGSKNDVDARESIHEFVENEDDWDVQFPVTRMSVEQLKELKINNEDTVLDAFEKFATKKQKKLVDFYKNHPDERNQFPIVLAGKYLADGNHRVVAAIISSEPINAIDVYGEEIK
jgi:hypothetical protein